jgi:iron complex outermembrane receptor protein
VESKFKLTKLDMLTVALNNTFTEAATDGYKKNPYQNKLALTGSYKIHNTKQTLNGFLNVRQELISPDNDAIDTIVFTPFKSKGLLTKACRPFTYSIGGEGHFFERLSVNFSVAQHYRIPTFNDLYWARGGNIHLKPESGWGEELGLTYKQQIRKLSITVNATAFNRNINNWILWSPVALDYWSPVNVLKVWSRGAEYGLNLKYPLQKVSFALNLMWNYTVSTNEKAERANDASLHKQLMYTPMYKGNGSLTAIYKNFSIAYNQKYVGYAYTSSDHKYFLKPYLLSNIKISQLLTISEFKLQLFAGINNLFDQRYETIEDRPMPGRNYQIGCMFYFNNPNKLIP